MPLGGKLSAAPLGSVHAPQRCRDPSAVCGAPWFSETPLGCLGLAFSGLELGGVCPSVAVSVPLPRPSVRYAVASLAYSGPLYSVGLQTANEMGQRAAAKLFKL